MDEATIKLPDIILSPAGEDEAAHEAIYEAAKPLVNGFGELLLQLRGDFGLWVTSTALATAFARAFLAFNKRDRDALLQLIQQMMDEAEAENRAASSGAALAMMPVGGNA
jgi:hypothetical protein